MRCRSSRRCRSPCSSQRSFLRERRAPGTEAWDALRLSVVNISSTAGVLGSSLSGHSYSATKGGLNSLTRSMAAAYAKHQVRVNAICPGSLEPVMKFGIPRTPERQKMLEANYPIGRLGAEEDVVHLAVYLASDESAWTTGAVIPVDGGFKSTS